MTSSLKRKGSMVSLSETVCRTGLNLFRFIPKTVLWVMDREFEMNINIYLHIPG